MRKIGRAIATVAFAMRLNFATAASMIGSAFVGAVFGVGSATGGVGGAVVVVSVAAIIGAILMVTYAIMVSGVYDDELLLRRQAAQFVRHRKNFDQNDGPSDLGLEDELRATSAYRRRVRDELIEARVSLARSSRREAALKRHLAEIESFERSLRSR